jgi:hypothetical protein
MSNNTSNLAKAAKRAREIALALARVKPLYQELDELTELFIDAKANLSKYGLAIQDNFETKNTAWKSTPMRRFELVVIPVEAIPSTSSKKKNKGKQPVFNFR